MFFNPKQFLSEPEEVHALVIGMGEVICPWPARYHVVNAEPLTDLSKEHHYYQLGRILGMLILTGIVALLKRIFS